MFWYILISLLLIFLLWLLLVPVIIYTNTERNRYLVALPGIFRAVVVPEKGMFHIRGWIFFIPFRFHPFRERKRIEKVQPGKNKRRKWRSGTIRMMVEALSAFRIKRLEAEIDTDDFTLNAWLVPVFSAINGDNIRLHSNFEGNNSLVLDLRVTLGALFWILIKTKYKTLSNH
jgi:hypothetical protein